MTVAKAFWWIISQINSASVVYLQTDPFVQVLLQ